MRSDKLKNNLKVLLKNCIAPIGCFLFCLINLITCLWNPSNFNSLQEVISNDISRAKTENGLVRFELNKKKPDYNFLYVGRYYFDEMATNNKKGKEYAIFKEKNFNFINGEEDKILNLDYAIGIIDATSFDSLDFTFANGEIKTEDYKINTETSHCVVSRDLAQDIVSEFNFSSFEVLLGKTINYGEQSFIVDSVVENSTFVNNTQKELSNKFISFRYDRISNSLIDYSYNILFNKKSYYDNYSILSRLFSNIYRQVDDYYFELNVENNEWIVEEIDAYRINFKDAEDQKGITRFIVIYCVSIVFGVVTGLLAKLIFKSPRGNKQIFNTTIACIFTYFATFFVIGRLFNNFVIQGIHLNIFSAYQCLYSLIYIMSLVMGILVIVLFLDNIKEDDLSEKPLVSIIIPVYNGSNYLKLAIESALRQTYSNIEVIVVNDGSNDNGATRDVAKSIENSKLRYFEKENGGVASALNFGIAKSKGKYIAWLSHDDLFAKNKILNDLYAIEQSKETNVIPFSTTKVIDKDGKKRFRFRYQTRKNCSTPASYFSINKTLFTSLLLPKECLDEEIFVPELKYSQDKFAYFRLLENKYKFVYVENAYTLYRVHDSQGSVTRIKEFAADAVYMKNYFIDYFKRTNDVIFIKNYLLNCAKLAAGFDVYGPILKELFDKKKEFGFSNTLILRCKIKRKIYVSLYKIKRRLFGR